MHNPRISLIAALTHSRGIGKDNKLLWHISEDMKRFAAKTRGHVVIMGRKTYESIGRPLPHRTNIVVTRSADYAAEGCKVYHSVDEALQKAKDIETEEIFVIGGAEIYRQAIDKADRLYLTIVEGEYEADTFFPEYSHFTKILNQELFTTSRYSGMFIDLERT